MLNCWVNIKLMNEQIKLLNKYIVIEWIRITEWT